MSELVNKITLALEGIEAWQEVEADLQHVQAITKKGLRSRENIRKLRRARFEGREALELLIANALALLMHSRKGTFEVQDLVETIGRCIIAAIAL